MEKHYLKKWEVATQGKAIICFQISNCLKHRNLFSKFRNFTIAIFGKNMVLLKKESEETKMKKQPSAS